MNPDEQPGRLWMLLIPAVHVAGLAAMHRRWWCACGSWAPWVSDAFGRHNSQHLFDPYSFSHIEHGLCFYLLGWLLRRHLTPTQRLAMALILETIWELIENSDPVIRRYRQETASALYYGDTIANSLGDSLSALVGYWLASRLRPAVSVGLFVTIEIGLLLFIRDSLLMNIVMLTFPNEGLKHWQAKG